MSIKALILCGDGINCEKESARAFTEVGFESHIVHISDLIANPTSMNNYQALCLPGGFSFGDEISSGKVLALKIEKYLKKEFKAFVDSGKPVIGICNGFQVLAHLNLFDDSEEKLFSLVQNTSKKFIDRWVKMKPHIENECLWIQNLPETFELPIRHGEGRIVPNQKYLAQFPGLTALSYDEDVNGSYRQIAGITNKKGNLLGLMPHPEAAVMDLLHPATSKTYGLQFFQNAYDAIKGQSC